MIKTYKREKLMQLMIWNNLVKENKFFLYINIYNIKFNIIKINKYIIMEDIIKIIITSEKY